MTFLPPSNDIPPVDGHSKAPEPPPPSDGGRPNLSTTQVLLGVIAVLAALGVGAMLIPGSEDDAPLVSTILDPEDGEAVPPGAIAVRIRVATGDEVGSPEWELSYRPADPVGEWQVIRAGEGLVLNMEPGRGAHGLELSEPGRYEVRLTAQTGEFQASDSVIVTVE